MCKNGTHTTPKIIQSVVFFLHYRFLFAPYVYYCAKLSFLQGNVFNLYDTYKFSFSLFVFKYLISFLLENLDKNFGPISIKARLRLNRRSDTQQMLVRLVTIPILDILENKNLPKIFGMESKAVALLAESQCMQFHSFCIRTALNNT